MATFTNLTKNTSSGLFDIATFDVSTFNPWINSTKNTTTITNLSKSNSGASFFDIATFDVSSFNNWSNLAKS